MNRWHALALELRRRRAARRSPPGPLRAFHAAPAPSPSTEWRAAEFVVVDLETTGPDPRCEEVVSAGWVIVRRAAVELGTATRRMVRPSKAMPESSAVIHAITDDEAAEGEPFEAVLADLLGTLAGRVLVAHYAPAELGFLDRACRNCLGGGLVVPVVDTLQLARRACDRAGREPARGELRLGALRAAHHLPPHAMHDALGDAVATAELFLAQAENLAGDDPMPLRSLLSWP